MIPSHIRWRQDTQERDACILFILKRQRDIHKCEEDRKTFINESDRDVYNEETSVNASVYINGKQMHERDGQKLCTLKGKTGMAFI